MATRCLLVGHARCGARRSLAEKTGTSFGRFISTKEKKLQEGQQQHYANTSEPSIPLVPKNRDPHAVLKALSSTVTPVKYPLIIGRSQSDPLAACNLAQQMQFIMAQEAGKKAAEYVINRYPQLFPWKQPVPDLRNQYRRVRVASEDNLKYLIAQRDSSRALVMFNKLNEKGVTLSMETQNSLLGLLAYLGRDRPKVDLESTTSEDKEKEMAAAVDEAVQIAEEAVGAEALQRESEQVAGDTEASFHDKTLEELPNMVIPEWSEDNPAEKFFAEMPEKDGSSYAAMICGLVKFNNYSRAFRLFEEAREKDLQIDVHAYNHLLLAILRLRQPNFWERAKKLVEEMNKGPVIVKPNLRTMNTLLELTYHDRADSTKTAAMVMREITHLGFKPTLTTLLRVLEADTKLTSDQLLHEIIDYIETHPEIMNITEHSDIKFFSLAMKKAKYTDLAIRIKNLGRKDNFFLIQHVPFFLSTFFSVITYRGVDIDVLFSEYRNVVPSVYVPHEWVYERLLRACISSERSDIAMQLWKDVVRFRVELTRPDVLYRTVIAFKFAPKEEHEQCLFAIDHAWNRLLYNNWEPTDFMISVPVEICANNGQLDKAWEYYAKFEEFELKPTFYALSALLNAYLALNDKYKVFEIIDKMILVGYWLPQNQAREIFNKLKVSTEERDRILDEIERNYHKSRVHYDSYDDGAASRDKDSSIDEA